MKPKPTFAVRLASERLACDLTQEALARKAGISVRTIARLEADDGSPSYDTRERLEKVLPGLIERGGKP